MIRSMYAGITGMKNFQTKLDVVGNNIANVNTYGFKKGRVTFQDLVSQQIAGATAPGDLRGGLNPRQVGLGSQLASIDTIGTQGSLQTTGRPLDLGISGDGFFAVAEVTDPGLATEAVGATGYTRAGNFYLDSDGFIVSAEGLYLMGLELDAAGVPLNPPQEQPIQIDPNTTRSFSIGSDGSVSVVDNTGALDIISYIGLVKFANPEGLNKTGGNVYQESANSGVPQAISVPGTNATGTLVAGTLEMSNVDLSEEFTEMIVAQRGFQANTRMITTSDEILQEIMQMKR